MIINWSNYRRCYSHRMILSTAIGYVNSTLIIWLNNDSQFDRRVIR